MSDSARQPSKGAAEAADERTSARAAYALLAGLRRAGVTDVVLSPGSRSAALAVALHRADAEGLLRLHVRIDERTAAFLALGLTKGSHRPVAVMTTSGTAVANLHPAVLEAVHAGARLLVISADRPAALRGTGANQTTDQVGIFGARVPCVDVVPGDVDAAVEAVTEAGLRAGPSHVNVQFADPILPVGFADLSASDAMPGTALDASAAGPGPKRPPRGRHGPAEGRTDARVRLDLGPRTVVVAGDDAGPPARLFAQDTNWPLLAEPTSGARTGSHALRTYRLLLSTALADDIERVVVTGHPTLSRPVTRLISRTDIEVLSVPTAAGICTDPGRVATHLDALPAVDAADDDRWLDAWRDADQRMSHQVDELAADPEGFPLRVAAEIAAAVTPEGLLTVGSSQPIRDLDVMAPPYQAGQRRLIIGNRGLAGIDGTVSTALGAALGRRSSRALAYMGDLTFLHDANGLVLGRDEPRPDLTIVVVNDDGGAIFTTLEQGAPPFAASFERVFGTPHGVSIEDWCRATHTAYEKVADSAGLRATLAEEGLGIRVIEVPLNRSHRRALDERLRALSKP
ncbi:MAG TPA: 2-succinyl-5-enolpyruvyl-6-hydroxy-3-cyclohexene-1-carboxylic-acid synthase [Nocardioidaceae bacterium]|nr:2-succinyl-5-enolpyruvyl-6-hydroxy-3-cyclohexene-1-carboxylic-acid synthase [Nocardioidaceae bacterium]